MAQKHHVFALVCMTYLLIAVTTVSADEVILTDAPSRTQAQGMFGGLFNPTAQTQVVEDTGPGSWDRPLAFIVIVAIFALPICLFRAFLWNLEKNVTPLLQSTLRALYREMMSLGLVALLADVLLESKSISKISKQLLPDEAPSAFVSHFHDTNRILLIAIATYLVLSVRLTVLVSNKMEQWREFERRRKELDGKHAAKLLKRAEHVRFKTFSCMQSREKEAAESVTGTLEYVVLRQEFLNRDIARSRGLDQNFDFAEYLCSASADMLANIVAIGVGTWTAVGIVVLIVMPPLLISKVWLRVLCLLGISILACLPLGMLQTKLDKAKQCVVRKLEGTRSDAKTWTELQRVDTPFLPEGVPFQQPDGSLPEGYSPSWLGRARNLHESLFWFGSRGPAFVQLVTRVYHVLTALYVGVAALIVVKDMPNSDVPWLLRVVYGGALVFPPFVYSIWVGRMVPQLTILTHVEFMRDNDRVDEVLVESRLRKAKLATTLMHSVHTRSYNDPAQMAFHRATMLQSVRNGAISVDILKQGFHAVIGKGDPKTVGPVKLRVLFHWLGVKLTKKQTIELLGGATNRVHLDEFVLMVTSFAGLHLDESQAQELMKTSLYPSTSSKDVQRVLQYFDLSAKEATFIMHDYHNSVDFHTGPPGSIQPVKEVNVARLTDMLRTQVDSINFETDVTGEDFMDEEEEEEEVEMEQES